MIYLDNAATTYPKPEEVYDYFDQVSRHFAFNAGRGESNESQEANDIVEKARSMVAGLIPGLAANRVVFTSSATEALNMLILGLDAQDGDTIYISPFEHNAIVRPLERLKDSGVKVKILPFDKEWNPDLNVIKREFAIDPPLAVFLSAVSNVTGYLLPYSEIFALAKRYDAITVLDAAQGFGIVRLDGLENTDYLVFAGHKTLYGCFGVGGFAVLNDRDLPAVLCGGTGSDSLNPHMPEELPFRYEAGSRNVPAIASLIKSIAFLNEGDRRETIQTQVSEDVKSLIDALSSKPGIHLFVPPHQLPLSIVSFAIDGYRSDDVGLYLSQKGISVRTGYHCAPFVHDFIGSKPFGGTVRVSFGAFNSFSDVKALATALEELYGTR